MLYGYFGMLSDFCWRRGNQELQPIAQGVCFCNIYHERISQGAASLKIVHTIIDRLQLHDVQPPPDKYEFLYSYLQSFVIYSIDVFFFILGQRLVSYRVGRKDLF